MKHLADLYQEEQELLKQYDQRLLLAQKPATSQELLKKVGIDVDFGFLPKGYINFYNEDFIVEEIDKQGKLKTIEPESSVIPAQPGSSQPVLYADLVKTGTSTLEAAETLAKKLGVAMNKINYAGIKDKLAITAQQVSIEGADLTEVAKLQIPGMFLKNFSWHEVNSYKGGLRGNRFTIVIRTPSVLGQGWLETSLKKIKQQGFYNFYYLQRFGAPRLVSHNLGRLLLQQNYQGAVEMFLGDSGSQDVGLLNNLRQQAKENFGNWAKVAEIFSALPYTFRLELEVARYLEKSPQDYFGALKLMHDQLAIWVYSYASYLFNLHLSKLINEQKTIPHRLPLLFNPKYNKISTYVEHLEKDGIGNLEESLEKLFAGEKVRPQMRTQNTYATTAPAKILKSKIVDKAVVLAFELGIGVYATTFLSHLFDLDRGLPVPDWVAGDKLDAKKILGLGSVELATKVLGETNREQKIDNYFF